MAGWVWIEGNIHAPIKDVFEYFADDTDKLSYLLPSTRVVNILERTRLPNGGERIHMILNVSGREHDVVGEDTEYQPFTLLRGRSSGPAGTVESEKRFYESNGRTRVVWGYRVTELKGLMRRLNGWLMPSYLQLSARLSLLGMLARARAALEPVPRTHPVTEPAWVGVHMPPPAGVRFGWATWAVWGIAFAVGLTALTVAANVWPAVALDWKVEAAALIPGVAVLMLLAEGLAWVALRILPNALVDTRR